VLFQLTVGQKVDSEQLPEIEETAENFDDCSLNIGIVFILKITIFKLIIDEELTKITNFRR
jgi:hypothetical protein